MCQDKSMTRSGHGHKIIRQSLGTLVLTVLIGASLLLAVRNLGVVTDLLPHASIEPANIIVDTAAILGTFDRPWQHLAQGGEGHDWRLQPIAAQVRALNPSYIRLDHIFDFYDIVSGTPGNIQFNFSKFDLILSDIQSVGAKPYIALSYMTPSLAEGGELTGPPVRYEDWQLMVQKTIEHVSGTRGMSDVYYEVWNEPDLFGGWKYHGSRNYLTLYTYAARGAAAARVSQPFKIGGPAITALYKNWFDALMKHVQDNKLKFDFFSWHRYDTDIDVFKKDMFEVRQWIAKYPQLEPTVEFHITEWGHDSKNNAGYDGLQSAAHTVAGAIEMIGVVNRAFVFEIQDGKDPAGQAKWGRWGLFTHADFGAQAKPRYHALKLLENMGPERLQLLGKGSYVKAFAARKGPQHWQVILSNYDPRGKNTETVPVTFKNLPVGTYTARITYVSKAAQTKTVTTQSSDLQIAVPLGVYEVALVELTPQ